MRAGCKLGQTMHGGVISNGAPLLPLNFVPETHRQLKYAGSQSIAIGYRNAPLMTLSGFGARAQLGESRETPLRHT